MRVSKEGRFRELWEMGLGEEDIGVSIGLVKVGDVILGRMLISFMFFF